MQTPLWGHPPAPFTCGEVEGLSVCSDGCDLQCRRTKSPHGPRRVPGLFFLFGWGPVRRKSVKCGGGSVCPALSNSPGDSAQACCPEGRARTCPSREGCTHPHRGTYETSAAQCPALPQSLNTLEVPSPLVNQLLT